MCTANVKRCDIRQRLLQEPAGVGRVQKHDVELLPAAQIRQRVPLPHPGPVRQAAQRQIFLYQLHRVRPPVDEHALRRAPAQGLDA